MLRKIIKKILRIGKSETTKDKLYAAWFSNNGDQTLRLNYNLDEQSVVFDLGGYQGQWASDIFSKYLCNVYIFEPYEKYYQQIKQRFIKNAKIKPFNFGLSNKEERLDLYISGDASSVYKTGSEKIQIQLKDVIQFLKNHKIEKIDLLKINIEGGEYDLMERLTADPMIQNIANVQIQFHEFVPNSKYRMNEIQRKISETHFLTYSYEFVWENWQLKATSNSDVS